tara:strand:+ start:4444 stop:4605 length:162 start_codon:yes stop_codon:yes gene_type:complete
LEDVEGKAQTFTLTLSNAGSTIAAKQAGGDRGWFDFVIHPEAEGRLLTRLASV